MGNGAKRMGFLVAENEESHGSKLGQKKRFYFSHRAGTCGVELKTWKMQRYTT